MTFEEVVRRLQNRVLVRCSEQTGISYQQVVNIARGVTKNPSLDTYQKLVKWLEEN